MKEKETGMWLEKINARTAGDKEAREALDICRKIHLSAADNKLLKMTIFRNAKYGTDIGIHLEWKFDPGAESPLGRAIVEALADLGLIRHTIWLAENFRQPPPKTLNVR